jgi:flagellar hook-associated protein 2
MADDLTSSLVSGSIRFTGLGSGTDFDSMVTKLVEVEQIRTKRLQIWRSSWEAKSEAFDALTSSMLSLKGTMDTMNTTDKFLIKNAVSSNPIALTATAGSNAEESTHQVDVHALATNDMHMGVVIFSSQDAVVSGGAAGTFAFTIGGRQVSVNVTSTTTLSQFASLINSDADNRNYVRASVVNDGSGFRLQIRGMELGAGNDFIVDDSATSPTLLPNFGKAQFIETQNASNAQLRVDGFPLDPPTPTANILKATITGKTTADTFASVDGQFKFAYDGSLHSVAVAAADTWEDLADKINALGVITASAANVSGNMELTLTGSCGGDQTNFHHPLARNHHPGPAT